MELSNLNWMFENKGMEMNEKNNFRIFFHSLFGSFNGGNGKLILMFRSLSRREWNG